MKVLHVFNELKFSGAEIMYVDAASFFMEKGCELTAMSTSENLGDFASHFIKNGYKVLHKPFSTNNNFYRRTRYFQNFIHHLKMNDYDVVHIHINHLMWSFVICTWLARKKSIYTFHSVFSSRKHSYLLHVFQRWSAKHIFRCRFQTISDSVYNNELKKYYNRTNKTYNWYGSNRFYPAHLGEKDHVRSELNIPHDALVIISIGGCSAIKRHSEVINALPIICSDYPTTIYLHLGEGDPEEDEKKLAEKLRVNDNIRFVGNQTDVRKYLIASDFYVMPSLHEGMPITAIEAMACSIPAVFYNVPGLRDFNKDVECCLLIEEDHKILANSIIHLFSQHALSKRLAKEALEMVNDTYCLEKNASEIYQLYLS